MRLPDWETRLSAYLDANATRAFEFGAFDCALFVAGAVDVMTGFDFGEPFRGKYKSAAGAVRALREHGAGTLPQTLAAALGPPWALALAHRGDVCWHGTAAGILQADHGLFVGREDSDDETFGLGLVRIPRARLDPSKAWRVGVTL